MIKAIVLDNTTVGNLQVKYNKSRLHEKHGIVMKKIQAFQLLKPIKLVI